jgi:hypothetical protein
LFPLLQKAEGMHELTEREETRMLWMVAKYEKILEEESEIINHLKNPKK